MVVYKPIKQDPKYHDFADKRHNNFLNIISNLPFVLIGIYGLVKGQHTIEWKIFYISIILVGIGSIYYHQKPTNQSLIWDRLPMTIAFMSIFFIFLQIRYKINAIFFYILLIIGIYSIYHWVKFDDLLIYGIVQYVPILIMIFILLIKPESYDDKIWKAILLYLIAKICENLDKQIYKLSNYLISGHTIKHIFGALSIIFIIQLSKNYPQNYQQ